MSDPSNTTIPAGQPDPEILAECMEDLAEFVTGSSADFFRENRRLYTAAARLGIALQDILVVVDIDKAAAKRRDRAAGAAP